MPVSKTTKKSPRLKASDKSVSKQYKSKNTRKKIVALAIISLGIVFIFTPLFFYLNQTIQLAYFTPQPTPVVSQSTQTITQVAIPAIQLQTTVRETAITNGVWEIANDHVSYLKTSARPGENDTIILYAHNTYALFKKLPDVKTGDDITITTKDGILHNYTVEKTLEVFPNQMEVFDQKDETLILYTCSGFADLQRFIVIAKPSR